MESQRILLVTFNARADGSYTSPTFRVPEVDPGRHLIIVSTLDGEIVQPVTITAAGTGGGGNGGGGGAPTKVLGTTTAANGGGGGGGKLPFTGGNIARLVIWALALLGAGTALAVSAWRRAQRLEPVRVVGERLRRRNKRPPALPLPDVPYIDTTGFVPVRPRRGIVPSSTITEADAGPTSARD